jgi:cytochrome P450
MDEFQLITGGAVAKIFLGHEPAGGYDDKLITKKLANLINNVSLQAIDPFVMLFGPKIINLGLRQLHRDLVHDREYFLSIAREIIERTKREYKAGATGLDAKKMRTKGIIQLLVERNLQHEGNQAEQFSENEILNEFMVFYVAGMDTTGHLTEAAIWNMLKYPDTLRKLKEEIRHVFANENEIRAPTMDQLASLKYMNAFVKETARMAPISVITFDSILSEDVQFGKYTVKKDSAVSVCTSALGYNSKYFTKPDEFRPERWINEDEVSKIHPFCDVQFSAGPRNCIGQHVAKTESKLILLHWIHNFDFKLSDPNYKRVITSRFLDEPETPMLISVTKRTGMP